MRRCPFKIQWRHDPRRCPLCIFLFFQQGSETIKRENVYEPLKLYSGIKPKFLDFKLLRLPGLYPAIKLVRDTAAILYPSILSVGKDDGMVGPNYFLKAKKNSNHYAGGRN